MLRIVSVGLFWAFFLLLAVPGSAHAVDHTVGGACGATIQDCIDFASPTDTVRIPAGNYLESLSLAKAVSLIGDDEATTVVSALGLGLRVLTVDGATIDSSVLIEQLTLADGDVSGGNICHSGDPTNCGGCVLVDGDAQPSISHVTIRDCRAYRGGGMYTDEGSPLTLDDLTFLDNAALTTGGGARFDDPVQILSSRFEGNVSEFSAGGGFSMGVQGAIKEPPSSVAGSIFVNNISNSSGAGIGGRDGGAISAFAIDLAISDSHFEGNHCLGVCDGGAITFSTSFFPTTLNLTRTDFVGNAATRRGGAVEAGSFQSSVVLDGGLFDGNSATTGGGLSAGPAEIDGTVFSNNTAFFSGLGSVFDDGYGGGAFVNPCPSSIVGVRFEGNMATNGGGLACNFDTAILDNVAFVGNSADENGGGFFTEAGALGTVGGEFTNNTSTGDGAGAFVGGAVTIEGTSFTGNLTQLSGGGLYGDGDVDVVDASFVGNEAAEGVVFFNEGGGGIRAAGALDVSGTYFGRNRAPNAFGGGVNAAGTADLHGVTFEENEANRGGGGIIARDVLTIDGGSLFLGNLTDEGSGGGASGLDAVSVVGGRFSNNVVGGGFGGGGGLAASGVTVLSGVEFSDNFASLGGGGLRAFAESTIDACSFLRNETDASGGGVQGSFDQTEILDSEFVGNRALVNGGAISHNGSVVVADGTFRDNVAGGTGGAASTFGRVFATGATSFTDNTSAGDGGAIWANSGVELTDTRVENNESSGGSGGGISAPLGDLNATGVRIAGNRAAVDGGGGLAFRSTTMVATEFVGNVAGGDGGGYWFRKNATITDSNFENNSADGSGGGIHKLGNTGSTATILEGVVVHGNIAGTNGGGIASPDRPNELINTTISGNNALGEGGGLWIGGTHPTTLSNVTVAENSAGTATGLFNSSDSVEFTNTLVSGDCVLAAGAFLSNGGNLESLGDSCGFGDPTDQANVAAAALNLAPLADNGGATLTHALNPGSVAIDAGVAPCPVDDQRDEPRFDGSCDAGAFEWVPETGVQPEQVLVSPADACNGGTDVVEVCITPELNGSPVEIRAEADGAPGSLFVGFAPPVQSSGPGQQTCFEASFVGAAGFAGALLSVNFVDQATGELLGSIPANLDCTGPLLITLESFGAELLPGGVQLHWRTGMEIDTAGFRVLRSAGGRAAELLNPWLIPAEGGELFGASYEYLHEVKQQPGRFYYYLEDLDFSGRITRHGPIVIEFAEPGQRPGDGHGGKGGRR